MGAGMKANGSITTWTASELTSGVTVVAMKVNTTKIKSTVSVFTNGLTAEFTLVTGVKASNTD